MWAGAKPGCAARKLRPRREGSIARLLDSGFAVNTASRSHMIAASVLAAKPVGQSFSSVARGATLLFEPRWKMYGELSAFWRGGMSAGAWVLGGKSKEGRSMGSRCRKEALMYRTTEPQEHIT